MEKDFKRAIIVGKFCPLHKGHELLINTALEKSNELILFSYTSETFEHCSAQNRQTWLTTLFPTARVYVFDKNNIANWNISKIPDDSADDETQRQFVCQLYENVIGLPLDAIFTSESYGEGFTQVMSNFLISKKIQNHRVTHISVDQPRKKINISGTRLREDTQNLRHYLSAVVYRSFLKKILFLGAESTGKSTLTELCAEKYKSVFVDEFGRTLYEEKKGHLELGDMLKIAETHNFRQSLLIPHARNFLFVDTSPLTTLCYSQFLFNTADTKLEMLANDLDYDIVFYCEPDFPMVQDGTRVDEAFRNRQHQWYRQQLSKRGIKYISLSGTLQDRMKTIDVVLADTKAR